jgi:hypothetical protein
VIDSTLPPGAREALEREGWLLLPKLLGASRLRELERATVALERSAATLVRDAVAQGVGFEVQSASGRKGEPAVEPGALRKISFPSKAQGAFNRLQRDPGLLVLLEHCGLTNPTCHVDQVNLKRARVGSPFPFHQDARFVMGRTQGRIERHGGLNLVIALDAADAGNGGFEVLGRTHRSGLVDFSYDAVSMNEGVFDETHRLLVPLAPGDAVLFHPHLAHGSGANTSDRPRRLVTMWFVGGA